ncbi:hypothetical protein RSP673_016930 (plasmid) [Ralstonia solanacearum P673]|uniref:hypothetical protein n=1 Tax=Ralstonia solanacearum TaxID=305 RepID=UPI000F6201E7|nr:hypothetical protein [Ralstonia solanacearum]MBB6588152.1 hypothetical protein [Ralstonia solanacearum]MCG3575039.1 hypothetical protein [Ralstonia solanacearum]MCL9839471.1 hypothetical protein [Ralstonia solanacearum]MCL9851520.1 hypothetical protein [Ralstonia solanacearum]MCL9854411.1 hypothetical protein [Ralstonia solanacearum]
MNISSSPVQRENIGLQAKRLGWLLDIPLTSAKEILARGPYRCDSWIDLESRVDSGMAGPRMISLSLVGSEPSAMTFFDSHLDEIAESISRIVLTNSNRLGLREIAYEVFTGQRKEMSLADVLPSVPEFDWEPAKLGPDPYAVMFATVSVNGIAFRLVATRIYVPRYFEFDSEISSDPDLAEPLGKLRIMWSDPSAWRDAAQAFLCTPDDDWEAELVLPEEHLDEAMAKHASWFEGAMSTVARADQYTDDPEERLVPYLCSQGPYAVFGFPMASQLGGTVPVPNVDCQLSDTHDRQPLLIGGWPVCLEWYEVGGLSEGGDFDEYISLVRETVPYPDAHRTDQQILTSGLLFVRPATGFDLVHAVSIEIKVESNEEALTLKSDDLPLAAKILSAIASRQIHIDRRHPRRYFCVLDVTKHPEVSGLRLVVDIELPFGGFVGSNLTDRVIPVEKDGVKFLLVELRTCALALVKLLGKKTLIDALTHGLIVRCASGLAKGLDVEPPWIEKLVDVEPSVAELFDQRVDFSGSLFDLFRNVRVVKFKRDNK